MHQLNEKTLIIRVTNITNEGSRTVHSSGVVTVTSKSKYSFHHIPTQNLNNKLVSDEMHCNIILM